MKHTGTTITKEQRERLCSCYLLYSARSKGIQQLEVTNETTIEDCIQTLDVNDDTIIEASVLVYMREQRTMKMRFFLVYVVRRTVSVVFGRKKIMWHAFYYIPGQ